MDQMRPHTGHFRQYAFTWKSEFGRRQTQAYKGENIRYVEQYLSPDITPEEVIEQFTDNQCHEDIHRYRYMRKLLKDFLRGSDLNLLRQDFLPGQHLPLHLEKKALLDDRNDANGARDNRRGNQRPSRGGLTALELYNELKQRRLGRQDFQDSERRVIYIADLDSPCALALAATASPRQAVVLRDFMSKHLAFRALIGVEMPPVAIPTFALEFHLPYYAWRELNSGENADERQTTKTPEEVIHLRVGKEAHPPTVTNNDYIYEARCSVMVAGIDDWLWTAYCFVDVNFKGSEHRESIENYANPGAPGPPNLVPPARDPLSCGKREANKPIWNPREYFLYILSIRMEQVKQEWENSVFLLLQHIKPCINSFTRGETDVLKEGEQHITQQEGFKWTIRILRQFTHLLSKTIDSWERFKEGEMRYFNLPNSDSLAQPSWGAYLAETDKNVTDLRDLRSSLLHHTDLFENMTNSITTHAAHAEAISARLQARFIQALTVITICYLPPTLASAIFSMDILPKDVSFIHWIYTLLGLLLANILLLVKLSTIINFVTPLGEWWTWTRARATRFVERRWKQRNEDEEGGIELEDDDST
ncbi:hypothetical protein HYFRA_00010769 [Hymenoscyphus fraxineus]|uniref:Uncharacterized protein n=1 Tax=Hymenoscyphus fraxineus TaxID=746836 RepID=A0A9N9L376_9HELO|nr:hypothetical protein HYFRA_00010769 [Hymenoscyphus fraxineus]